ncbi:hypothetical protein [Acinetobacter nectaris]
MVWLPTYSPDLNPIQKHWYGLKKEKRMAGRLY